MNAFRIVVVLMLLLHGLIHLMGTAAYLKLAEIQALPYKTTVLGGRWNLGTAGTSLFGALWTVCAIGFVLAAAALLVGWSWWPFALVGVTLFWLVITSLDSSVAFAGVVVNLAILAVVWVGPRVLPGVFALGK